MSVERLTLEEDGSSESRASFSQEAAQMTCSAL